MNWRRLRLALLGFGLVWYAVIGMRFVLWVRGDAWIEQLNGHPRVRAEVGRITDTEVDWRWRMQRFLTPFGPLFLPFQGTLLVRAETTSEPIDIELSWSSAETRIEHAHLYGEDVVFVSFSESP